MLIKKKRILLIIVLLIFLIANLSISVNAKECNPGDKMWSDTKCNVCGNLIRDCDGNCNWGGWYCTIDDPSQCPVSCSGCGSCDGDSRKKWCTGGQYGSGQCVLKCDECKTRPSCGNGRCEDGQGCWEDETSSNCPVDCVVCYPPSCTVDIGGDGSYSFTSSGDADGQLEYTCCGPTYGCISSGGLPTSASGCCLPPGSKCTLTVSNSCGTSTCSSTRQCECSFRDRRSCTTTSGCPGTQTCFNGCTWDPCRDIPNDNCPCSSLQGQPCGNCGTINCAGQCVNQGSCAPGQTEYGGSCGKCGTSRRDCASNCQWGNWYCTGEGPCSPGQTQDTGSCGYCGTLRKTCQSNCQWNTGTCINQGPCSPGQTVTQSCGNCGTQTSTCQSNCQYGSWGACTGQGPCAPGQTQNLGGCGNCGTLQRTCQGNCQWSSSTCINEGPCSSGSTQCADGKYQTCSSSCQWQNPGTDADSDGVDLQCDDATCDNARGVCDTAVAGKCIAKQTTETLCSDNLDNDCDNRVDDFDGDCLQVPSSSQCEEDCTYTFDELVHSGCRGYSGCTFYDNITQSVCDWSQPGWVRDYNSSHYVECASGSPQLKIEIKADVSCASGTLVKMTRIVVYNGKPVKLVVAVCG